MGSLAIISANIGGIDEVYGMPPQRTPANLYYYFLNNLPVPLPNLDNRTKSKYPKIQSHRFLSHDAFCWIDGRIQILTKEFSQIMIDVLGDNDMFILRHGERDTPYQEIEYIRDSMRKGSGYLLSRYGYQDIQKEVDFFEKEGLPYDYPLYHCNMFIRKNTAKVNDAFNDWWHGVTAYTNFDQAFFSYIAWKHDLKIDSEPIKGIEKIVRYHKHK